MHIEVHTGLKRIFQSQLYFVLYFLLLLFVIVAKFSGYYLCPQNFAGDFEPYPVISIYIISGLFIEKQSKILTLQLNRSKLVKLCKVWMQENIVLRSFVVCEFCEHLLTRGKSYHFRANLAKNIYIYIYIFTWLYFLYFTTVRNSQPNFALILKCSFDLWWISFFKIRQIA